MSSRLKGVILFIALLGFFVLTVPANHSEAEDAYYYACMAEQGAWTEMFHAHHLFYLPLMRIVFRIVQFAGYTGRALPILIGSSMVSGALAICLFAALLRRTGVKWLTVLAFSAALLFSYGFWRYSTTAEIYILVTALSLLTLYCAVRAKEHPLFFTGTVLSGAAALLLHLISLPVVLVSVPLLLTRRRAMVYLLLTLTITAAVYMTVAQSAGLTVFTDTQVVRDSLARPRVWLRGTTAFGQNLLSGNFLFAVPAVVVKLETLFPFQMLQEELFTGHMAPAWVRWLAPVTCGTAIAFLAATGMFAVRAMRRAFADNFALTFSILLWLGGTAAMAFLFEPANPEMWICTLAPFWLLAGLVWNFLPETRLSRWLPVGLAAALLLHNWIGGMSLVKSPHGDYCRQKSVWIAAQIRPGDLILTADSHSFVTFLEYQSSARIVDAKFINPAQWNELQRQATGRIFVFSDVLDLLPPVARRAPETVLGIREVSARLRAGLRPIHNDQFGTVYQWESL